LRGGSNESIILVVALNKGLFNTVNAKGVLVVIVGNVTTLILLIVVIVVALSKGLVVAIRLSYHPCMVAWPISSPLRQARVFLVGCGV
jgi:hypothetical protein